MKDFILVPESEIKPSTVVSHHATKYNSWVEIDTHAVLHNLANYKSIIAPAQLAPVIKSNAYGHGIELIASLCEQSSSVDMICVVSVGEALLLRSKGIRKPLLVLSILRDDIEQAVHHDIQLVVHDLTAAATLNELGKKIGKKIEVHIKVDTGLSRLGFLAHDALEIIEMIYKMPYLMIKGLFTHFADSESADQTFTNEQIARLNKLVDVLSTKDIHIPLRHASCSAAITANSDAHFNLCRVGIGVYGLWPSIENRNTTKEFYPAFSLKPVLTWKTTIIQLKEVPAGSYVGYSCTYKVERPSMIATLPIGYWDGYDRGFSNVGMVLIKNELCKVVGRVAMNLTMVDVTDLNVYVGDEVVLLGNHAGVTAEDLALRCQTINYEIVTRINPLLPRIGI
jgi:alanine racemase